MPRGGSPAVSAQLLALAPLARPFFGTRGSSVAPLSWRELLAGVPAGTVADALSGLIEDSCMCAEVQETPLLMRGTLMDAVLLISVFSVVQLMQGP